MKKLILILIPLTLFATPKKKLTECEKEVIRLTTLIEAKKDGLIVVEEPTNRKDVKIAKIESKQEIKLNEVNTKHEAETIKNEAKKAIKVAKFQAKENKSNNKKETKTNFVFQFFSTIKTFLWNMTLSQALSGGGGLVGLFGSGMFLGEKLKIFSKFGLITN
jgi:hypothetical protein